MLISTHAIHATLEAPFIAAGWELASDSSFGTTNIQTVTYNTTSRYVAAGNLGKIATSDNGGEAWTQRVSPFGLDNIYCSAYGNNIFVVGGSAGKIATSIDGVSWILRDSSFGASAVLGITYFAAPGVWIAVGASGKLATSIDAIEWVQRTSSFGTSFINEVYSSSSLSIAVGYDGKLATSTNGINWTQRGSSFVNTTIYDVVSTPDESQFIAVGDSGKIAVSSDGLSWAQIFPSSSFGGSSIRSVAANSDSYLASSSAGKLGTATNPPVTWAQRTSPFGLDTINSVYLDTSRALAVGDSGKIAYSG